MLYADKNSGGGIHVGFSFKASGDDVYLHDKAANGGHSWILSCSACKWRIFPSAGRMTALGCCANRHLAQKHLALPLGDPHHLKINEWLADAQFVANNDFIELFNPDAAPVELGGCFLSDAEGAPGLSRIPDLTFIPAQGYLSFVADRPGSRWRSR